MARKEKVIRVIDGDTFKTNKRKNPVRLANVDAPEKGTKGAAKVTAKLKKAILGKEVSIDTVARDKYGRSVAKVKADGKSVNKLVKDEIAKVKPATKKPATRKPTARKPVRRR